MTIACYELSSGKVEKKDYGILQGTNEDQNSGGKTIRL